MKFLHLADLHLGKALHALSLIESGDQPYWIGQLLDFVSREQPDAVVIAGDVYDRGIPDRKAIPLLSELLTGISRMDIPVFLIAGNHDGGDRLEFVADLLQDKNVFIAGTVRKEMLHITRDFHDGDGPVTFWLMPYLYPAAVRQALGLPDEALSSYTEAARRLLAEQPIDFTGRNVLIAHQTVLNQGSEPEHSLSETAIGGVGGIFSILFDALLFIICTSMLLRAMFFAARVSGVKFAGPAPHRKPSVVEILCIVLAIFILLLLFGLNIFSML